jgi:uncharacterized protein (TIGR00369 family)
LNRNVTLTVIVAKDQVVTANFPLVQPSVQADAPKISVVALADSACGYGCIAFLPEGATGFTTIELKTNFLGTVLDGTLVCEARRAHGGRTTQVWDATVTTEVGKTLALFRCTQLLLY